MIIEFRKIKETTLEDKFINTLEDEQVEMFYEIIQKIKQEYDELNNKYLQKVTECEILKYENKSMK